MRSYQNYKQVEKIFLETEVKYSEVHCMGQDHFVATYTFPEPITKLMSLYLWDRVIEVIKAKTFTQSKHLNQIIKNVHVSIIYPKDDATLDAHSIKAKLPIY